VNDVWMMMTSKDLGVEMRNDVHVSDAIQHAAAAFERRYLMNQMHMLLLDSCEDW